MIRDTSLEAYNQIKADGLLSQRRFEVYEILFFNGPLTAHEVVAIARKKYPLSNQTSFNARLSELEKIGVVKTVGKKLNEVSKHENILWDCTDRLPVRFDQPKKHKCSSCNGRGFFVEQQAKLF